VVVDFKGVNMNKKGFTIVELLAVIVVLSMILVIAVPKVLGAIETSKRETIRLKGESLVKEARNINSLNTSKDFYMIENNEFVGEKLNISGDLIDEGVILINSDGLISFTGKDDKYCLRKDYNEDKVRIDTDIEGCKIVGPTPLSCFTYTKTDTEVTITDYSNDVGCPKDIIIPDKIEELPVRTIGNNAFRSKQLKSVIIPDSVTSIREGAFIYNQLTSVTIPSSVITIEKNAFHNNCIKNLNISDGVTTIGDGAFAYNQLTNIIIPNSVISIGKTAFQKNQLTSITIPSSVTNLGGGAFTDNKLSNDIAFIYGRNSDGSENKSVLNSYGGLNRNNVIIPSTVTTIEEHAFIHNQLTNIIIPNSTAIIGSDAFANNQLTNITIPDSVTSIGCSAFNKNQLPDSQAFIYKRNSDGSEDKTTIVSYGGAKRDNIIIPSTVTTIGFSSFYGSNITSVTIPYGVTTIEASAFGSNQLTNITIPNSVVSLSNYSFAYNKLTSITIPDSVVSFGVSVFTNNQLTSVTIPANKGIGTNVISPSFYTSYVTVNNKAAGTYTSSCQTCTWTKQ